VESQCRTGKHSMKDWWIVEGGSVDDWWKTGGRSVEEWWMISGRVVDDWGMTSGEPVPTISTGDFGPPAVNYHIW